MGENEVSLGVVKLSNGNGRDHKVDVCSRLEILQGRAHDIGLRKTVLQDRRDGYERMEEFVF